MEFSKLSKQEYFDFYQTYDKQCFWQSLDMAEFESNKNWQIHYVGIKNDNKIIAAVTLISRVVFMGYSKFKALRGFLIDYNDLELLDFFLKNLKTYLIQNKCLYFEMDPYVEFQKHEKDGSLCSDSERRDDLMNLFIKNGFEHLGFRNGNDNSFEPRWMSVLNLENKNENQILKEMDAQTRQNVKNTIKTGIKVKELDESEYHIIHEIVSKTGERRHFDNPDLNYYVNFKKAFKENMKVLYAYLDTDDYYKRFTDEINELQNELQHIESLIVESNSTKNLKKKENCLQRIEAANKRVKEAEELKSEHGKEIPLGAAMFVITPYEVVYLFSGSYKQYNRFKGAYAIQWKMIRYALENKIKRYNFYGISGIFDESAEDYGVYEFKKGFNVDIVELIGNFRYINNKFVTKLYFLLKSFKNKLKKFNL